MTAPIPPAPGSVAPSELYVDLQSRTLWLGVGAAIDPNYAVLISDIEGVAEGDAATLVSANAYTDTRIATRAPTVHTHTSSQITDFVPAVNALIAAGGGGGGGSMPTGSIIMWSGSLASIGVGALAGWALCNGANGTPDLRDRFVVGAGNKAVGAVPASSNLVIGGGSHVHIISQTALSAAQMPSHSHGGYTSGVSADHQHHVSGVTDVGGNHQHGISTNNNSSAGRNGVRAGDTGPMGVTQSTEPAGSHQHTVNFWSSGMSSDHFHYVSAEGGGQGHGHAMVGGATHEHTVTAAQVREGIPYYALAYIMKL